MQKRKTLNKDNDVIAEALADFFHILVVPVLQDMREENKKEHNKTRESIEKIGQEVYEMKDYINDHEERLKKVEKAAVTS